MDKNDFIINFADIFDDTDISEITLDVKFRDIDEWSSLHAMAALNMIELKYSVVLTPHEMNTTKTVNELFELVKLKCK